MPVWWLDGNERLCAMEPCLRLKRFLPQDNPVQVNLTYLIICRRGLKGIRWLKWFERYQFVEYPFLPLTNHLFHLARIT